MGEHQGLLMEYLKSALVGLAAVFAVFVILPILAGIVSMVIFAAKHGFAGIGIAFDRPHWEAQSFAYWLAVFAVFGIAFLWELRQLAKTLR